MQLINLGSVSQPGFRAESWNTRSIFKPREKFQTSLEISRGIFLPETGDTVVISVLFQSPLLISFYVGRGSVLTEKEKLF